MKLSPANKRNEATLFIALVLVISYAFAGVCYLAKFPGIVVGLAYTLIPVHCAMFVQRITDQQNPHLNISFKINSWFLVAWLLPPIIAFGAIGVAILLPGISFTMKMETMFTFAAQNLPSALLAGITTNAIFAFGEEYGWRAFLLRTFKDTSFLKGVSLAGVFMMIVLCILLSFYPSCSTIS